MAIKIVVLKDGRKSTNDLVSQLQADGKEVYVVQNIEELIAWGKGQQFLIGCGNIPTDLILELIAITEEFNTDGYVRVARIGKAANYPNYDDKA